MPKMSSKSRAKGESASFISRNKHSACGSKKRSFGSDAFIERPSAKKPPCGGFGGKWEKGRVGLCRIDQASVFDDEPAVFNDMLDGIDPQMIDQEEIAGDFAQDEIHFLPDL